MFDTATLMVITIFLPLLGATIINLFGNLPRLRDFSGIIIAGLTAYCVFIISGKISGNELVEARLFQVMPGIPILFKAEALGLTYAMVATILWPVTILYSAGYLRFEDDGKQTRFHIFMAISVSAALGIAFSGNLLTMLVFYEILTLATYPLVTHNGDLKSIKAGRKYLLYLLGTSLALFIPAIIITNIQGGMEFTRGGVFVNGLSQTAVIALLLMFVYGIGKAALMPLHKWLPEAMVAPTPVSALLHAVAVVKAGVFCIIKIITFIFGLELLTASSFDILTYLTSFTIICAGLIALKQRNIKAMLAYSTIAQLAYVLLAASVYTPESITAASAHIFTHAIGKITLFFAAGAIIIVAGQDDLRKLNGIGRKMPLVAVCFFIASLSIIGLPYLPGGFSKELIIESANGTGKALLVTIVLYISMALNAAYLLPVTWRAFAKKAHFEGSLKTPLTIKMALIISTSLIISFSFYKPELPF